MLTRQSLQTIYQRKTQIRQKTRPVHTELGEGMHCHNGHEVYNLFSATKSQP